MCDKAIPFHWGAIACAILLQACTQHISPANTSVEAVSPRQHAILQVDSSFILKSKEFAAVTTAKFYANRHYQSAWYTANGLSGLADSLIDFAGNVQRYGLQASDYHADKLPLASSAKTMAGPDTLSHYEILLTNAFFSLAYHLRSGRLDSTHTFRLQHQVAADTVAVGLLNQVLANELPLRAALESQEPSIRQYRELKRALQTRLALPRDSVRAKQDIVKIAINMERWRWEDPILPPRYALVNIPAFELYLFEDDQIVMQSRVIVGTAEKPTPPLTSRIKSFVIYPYWNVPKSIATEELLPRIQEDSAYLASHNFEVLDSKGRRIKTDSIHWRNYSIDKFPFRLRQREGDDNTLGIIKFTFDNPFGIALHDTNERSLFRKGSRAFSHGCIRMQKAQELAHYLIANKNARISDARLDELFKTRERTEVTLLRAEPLLVRYFTCSISRGKVLMFPDCYDLDRLLTKAIRLP